MLNSNILSCGILNPVYIGNKEYIQKKQQRAFALSGKKRCDPASPKGARERAPRQVKGKKVKKRCDKA